MVAPLQERNPSMPMMALSYTKRQRWSVLPIHRPIFGANGTARCSCRNFLNCKNVGKHPRSEHGVKDASRDEEWVRDAWRDEQSNIGVACGKASGFWALDVDSLKGGSDSLAELVEKHGKLPDTVEAITGSGGRHLLFALPGEVTIRNRVGFAPGLDTRSDGGYIIVAPSLHESGKRYAWEASSRPDEVAIVAAPDWLLELVVGSPGEDLRDVAALGEADLPELNARIGRARRYLSKVPGAIAGKGGHLQTWLAALIVVRGFALPERTALDLLAAEYNPRCEPRWSLDELEHKVASASNDGRRPFGHLLQQPPKDLDGYEVAERAAIQDEPAADKKPASSGIEWIGTQDVFFSPLVEPTWIARGLQIGPGRPSMIAGYAWSMKSLASQSFILSVLSGRRLWGTSHLHCRQGRCRHIDFEQGRYPTLRRYRRLVAGMGMDPREFEDRLEVAVFPRGMFLNARSAEETYLRAFDGVDFALVDAYRSSVPGLDENESTAAEPLYMLGRVSEKTGCSVLLNHHAGKGEREDQRQAVRGSSAIFGALGTVLHLEAKKKGEPVRVSQTRGAVGGDGVGEEDFYLEAEDVAIGQDPRAGLRILYRSAEQVSPPISPANVAAAEVERVVAAVRREGQGGVRGADAAAGLAGMKTSRARIVVQIALSRGLLENVARKRSGERDEHRPVYVARDSSVLVPSPLGGDERDEHVRGRPGRAKDERDERDEHTENGRS